MAPEPYRWFIPGPGEDETIRSIVGRAKARYRHLGTYDDRLVAYPGAMPSLDSCSANDILDLAHRLDTCPRALFALRQPFEEDLVFHPRSGVSCPQCWIEADHAGAPRTFRRGCQSVFQLSCPVHPDVPLRAAWMTTTGRSYKITELAPPTPSARRLLTWVDRFAHALGACFFKRAPWPAHWSGGPTAAKLLLSACATNLGRARGYMPIHSVMIPLHLLPWVSRPPGRTDQLVGDPWMAMRYLIDPAVRRLAFWFTGWLTVSDMPIDLWPEGFNGEIGFDVGRILREQAMRSRHAQAVTRILDEAICHRVHDRYSFTEGRRFPVKKRTWAWKLPRRLRPPK